MLNKLRELAKKPFLRFLLVGGVAFVVDYGGFYLLYFTSGLALYFANSLSFGLGMMTSFLLNRLWTFGNRNFSQKAHRQFVFYSALALTNLFLTNLFVGLLNYFGVSPKFGKVITIAIIAVWNFYIYKKYIFSPQEQAESN